MTPDNSSETKTSDISLGQWPAKLVAAIQVGPPQNPVRIGERFKVLGILGSGGFATVYEGQDEVLDRKVAIKMPRMDRTATPAQREQFLREAQSLASLKHPGIVTVFDFGVHTDGRCYIVLEKVSGKSLRDRLAEGRLPYREATTLVVQIAEALHAAHQKGVVHRDLKPANILIDAENRPLITDFGLAVNEESQRDLKHEIAGTPAYMSPEQVRGETQYLDGRTDIWSLGVMLYELLSGKRPFGGRTTEETYDEILNRSPRPLRQMDENISADIEIFCNRCLDKTIAHRYPSAKDFADILKRLSGDVTHDFNRDPSLQLTSPPTSQRRWSFRTRLLATGFTLLAVIGVMLLGVNIDWMSKRGLVAFDPMREGQWQFPMKADPVVLHWNANHTDAGWKADHTNQRLELAIEGHCLMQYGSVAARKVEVKMTIDQVGSSDNSGFYFGYRPTPDSNEVCVTYEALVVENRFVDRFRELPHLSRYRIVQSRVAPYSVRQRGMLRTVPLDPALAQVARPVLNVTFSGERLHRVALETHEFLDLVDSSPQQAISSPTGFGVCQFATDKILRHATMNHMSVFVHSP